MSLLIEGGQCLGYRLRADFLRRLIASIQIIRVSSFQCVGISVISYVPGTPCMKVLAVKFIPVLVIFFAGDDVDVANEGSDGDKRKS